MRLGLDLSPLTGAFSGIARATLLMAQALFDVRPPTHEIIGFAPRPLAQYAAALAEIFTAQHSGENSVHITAPPKIFPPRAYKILWGQISLGRLARRRTLDVLWGSAHRLPLWLPKRMARVLTVHDLTVLDWPHTMVRGNFYAEKLLLPMALAQADAIVAVSTSTQDRLRHHFPCLTAPIHVIPLGAPQLAAPAPLPLALTQFLRGRRYLLFVGTLEPRKNLTLLLAAYSALAQDMREATPLIIAGAQGWGKTKLEVEIAKLELAQGAGRAHIFCTGFVEEGVLSALYHGAHALVFPSLYEGFGLPILEAQQCGVPVVAAQAASLPQVAGDGALYHDPHDAASLTKALARIITDDALHAALATKARANATRFSWHTSAKALLRVMEEAFHKRQSMF